MTDTMHDRLERLVADEPPLTLTLDAVAADGYRLRRRRTLGYAAGAVGTTLAATAVAVPLVLSHHPSSTSRLTAAPLALARAHPVASTGAALTAWQQSIADAIRSASPEGMTFDFSSDRWEPDNGGVEATADDGAGPGQLTVGISTATQQLHPCTDPEFAAGSSCQEQTLADGSVLSIRGTVEARGIRYTDVVLTHPDGSGVLAEAGNFAIEWPLPTVATPEQKRNLVHASRTDPPYTPQQLAQVAVAVNRAAFGDS